MYRKLLASSLEGAVLKQINVSSHCERLLIHRGRFLSRNESLDPHVAGPCPMWNSLRDPTCDLDAEIAWEGERRTKRRQLFTRVLYARITKNPPRFVLLVSNAPLFPTISRFSYLYFFRWNTPEHTVEKEIARVSHFFLPPFFHVYTKFYCPPSSSLFSIKTRGNVSDRHADRERSGRDVGCEQPRVQLPGKGFQG